MSIFPLPLTVKVCLPLSQVAFTSPPPLDIEVVGLGDAAAAGDESGGFQCVFGGGGEVWCDTHAVNNS